MKAVLPLIVATLICGVAKPANSETAHTVVLIAPEDERDKLEDLALQIESQFTESEVIFKVHWVERMPATLRDQEQLGAQIAREHSALTVFWCDLKIEESVYFYVSTADKGRILVRRLDGVGTEGVGDALAMISLTAVEGLIRGGIIDVTNPQTPIPQVESPPSGLPAPAFRP